MEEQERQYYIEMAKRQTHDDYIEVEETAKIRHEGNEVWVEAWVVLKNP